MDDEMLSCFIHMLINALRHDAVPADSALFKMLISRAIRSRDLRYNIFWDLVCASSGEGRLKQRLAVDDVFNVGDSLQFIYQSALAAYLRAILRADNLGTCDKIFICISPTDTLQVWTR